MKSSKLGSNCRDLKIINRLAVLNAIRRKGSIARYEIAKETGLTPPTVTVIVNELMKAKVVKETGSGESTGGRKPVMLELEPFAGCIFAIRLQFGEIVASLLDLGGNMLETRSFRFNTSSPDDVINVIKETFELFIERFKIPRQKVIWCGLSSAGIIDYLNGTIVRSTNLGWRNVPIGPLLSEALGGIPVHVENISNAAAWGEKVYGSARGADNLIYINLSIGIGAGIIFHNDIYSGERGFAGEVGHMMLLPENGPICSCGRNGCFEAVCGVDAVLKRIKSEVPDEIFNQLNISKVRLEIGDVMSPLFSEIAEVKSVLKDTGRLVGGAIATMISLFDITTVILGGELARLGDLFLNSAIKTVKECSFPEIEDSIQIVRSSMYEDPSLMGVYALVLEKVFSTDEWLEKMRAIDV